jgi:ubiquinone/menaquinone biosynthesis C-methylase UbiE
MPDAERPERPSEVCRRREPYLDEAVRALEGRYSSEAEAYQRMWAPQLLHLSERLLPELPLEHARHLLEVGAGVGSLLADLQEAAPAAHVVGVDLTSGMIARAPERFGRAVMDARALGLMDRIFDVGIMAFMLFHLPEPLDGLREMRRVLRPGGTIGTLTWGRDPGYPALDVWNEELDAHRAAPADRRLSRHALVYSCEKVASLLNRAGYQEIRCWTGSSESRMTVDEFLSHRMSHGTSKGRVDSLAGKQRSSCIERARRRIAELDEDGLVDRAGVVHAVATVPQ